MKYITIVLLLFPALYLLSYAKYEWKNNKLPAIGSVILAIAAVVFPAVMLFIR
ncbi:MAG: hypothetical protein N2484_16535 [Clostridia bacterium]|nr:hypothetical protein [Clostridia bacterium]